MGNHGVAADPDHNSEQDLEPRLCPALVSLRIRSQGSDDQKFLNYITPDK
jgi:hypothetical protein